MIQIFFKQTCFLFFWISIFFSLLSFSVERGREHYQEMVVNEAVIKTPPKWLKKTKVQKIINKIQRKLEWDIRRIQIVWHEDEIAFHKSHALATQDILAFAKKEQNTINMGPKIDLKNFDSVFAHELVHIILYQKYKDAIPKWLEEGLANYFSGFGKVDYGFLDSKELPNVSDLTHPYKSSKTDSKVHYMLSQAAIEMIASKCSLQDLLQLSVGEKLESYLKTFCELMDINASTRDWIRKKVNKPKF